MRDYSYLYENDKDRIERFLSGLNKLKDEITETKIYKNTKRISTGAKYVNTTNSLLYRLNMIS